MLTQACEHIPGELQAPAGEVCQECGDSGPLRVCVTCGFVGCCESRRVHDNAHARSSGHPVIKSLPLSAGSFTWCYECNAYVA